jgi:NADPH:quinone reductase-like Zn-dependent oxidoreductase
VPAEDRRIPMSDGAGDVLAVGKGVEEIKVGDKVISVFVPTGSMARHRMFPFHRHLFMSRAMVLTVARER